VKHVQPVVFAGQVDHGKSTLIARLVLDAGGFPEQRYAELEAACARRGVPFELSFLLDALQSERDQAVTIGSSFLWLRAGERAFAFIDAPGHSEFLKNMVSAASAASAAVIVVDAQEGFTDQTRRHALLLVLLGIREAIVAVNKMDAVSFSEVRYRALESEARTLLKRAGLTLRDCVPVVARDGDNVVRPSKNFAFYRGPTLLQVLSELAQPSVPDLSPAFLVQDVYRRNGQRVLAGFAEGDGLEEGARIVVMPSRQVAAIASVKRFPEDSRPIEDGEACGLVLDRPLYVDAGDVIALVDRAPEAASSLEAAAFWLGSRVLEIGDRVTMRLGTREVPAVVTQVKGSIDLTELVQRSASALHAGDLGEIALKTDLPVVVSVNRASGLSRFALYRDGEICGGGVVLEAAAPAIEKKISTNVRVEQHFVGPAARAARNGHAAGVVFMTGLPASGKSTLGKLLEMRLFERGWNAYFLDGDTLRTGLCGDLGFSQQERYENVRRVGEVAALFADAGCLVVVALVAPLADARDAARTACKSGIFTEIYVRAPVSVCERRDPKGHYRRARSGEISEFTGVSSVYEVPQNPELIVDTESATIDESLTGLLEAVIARYSTGERSSSMQGR